MRTTATVLLLLVGVAAGLRCHVGGQGTDDATCGQLASSSCASLSHAATVCLDRASANNDTRLEVVLASGVLPHRVHTYIDVAYHVVEFVSVIGPLATHDRTLGDANLAVVQCEAVGFLQVRGAALELRNVVVRDCEGRYDTGLNVQWPRSTLLSGVTFHNMTGDSGTAVNLFGSSETSSTRNVTVEDCVFQYCSAASDGVLFVTNRGYDLDSDSGGGGRVRMRNVRFQGNNAGENGALTLRLVRVDLSHVVFEDNTCGNEGGGMKATYTHGTMRGLTLRNNSALIGGAIQFGDRVLDSNLRTVQLEDVTAVGNRASKGGAFSLWSMSNMQLRQSVFEDNSTPLDIGRGGHFFMEKSSVDMEDVSFVRGASFESGAVEKLNGVLRMTRVSFSSNSAVGSGGALLTNHDPRLLEGEDPSDELHLAGCVFANNTAQDGGAVFLSQGVSGSMADTRLLANTAEGDGGAVMMENDAAFSMQDMTFSNNAALTGSAGAVALHDRARLNVTTADVRDHQAVNGGVFVAQSSAVLRLTDVTSSHSSASERGGFLLARDQAQVHLEGCAVSRATASEGGGVLLRDKTVVSMTGGVLEMCTGAVSGGALQAHHQSQLAVSGVTLRGNSAGNGGAVFTSSSEGHAWREVVFVNNSAGIGVQCLGKSGYGGAMYYASQPCTDTLQGVAFSRNSATVAGGDVYSTLPPGDQCEASSLLPPCPSCSAQSGSSATYGARFATPAAAMDVDGVDVDGVALAAGDTAVVKPGSRLSVRVVLRDALGSVLDGAHELTELSVSLSVMSSKVSLSGATTTTVQRGLGELQSLGVVATAPLDGLLAAELVLRLSPAPLLGDGEWRLRVDIGSCSMSNMVWVPMEGGPGGVCADDVRFSAPQQFALFAVVGVTAVAVLTCCVLLLLHRNSRVLFAASLSFLIIIAVGLVLCVLSAALSVLDQTDVLCNATMWCFHVGFALVFGSMWLKQWRLIKIFNNNSLQIRSYSNRLLRRILSAYVCVLMALLLLWTLAWPRGIASEFERACDSDHETAFSVTFFTLHVLLVASLLALTVRSRNVPNMYNEVAAINLTVYNVLVLGVAGVVVSWTTDMSSKARLAVFVVLVCVLVLATVVFYMGHKFRRIYHRSDQFSYAFTDSSLPATHTPPTSPRGKHRKQQSSDLTRHIEEGRESLQGLRGRFTRAQERVEEIMQQYRDQEQKIASWEFEKQFKARRARSSSAGLHRIKSSYDLRTPTRNIAHEPDTPLPLDTAIASHSPPPVAGDHDHDHDDDHDDDDVPPPPSEAGTEMVAV